MEEMDKAVEETTAQKKKVITDRWNAKKKRKVIHQQNRRKREWCELFLLKLKKKPNKKII